ncbi:MAG: tetratricopeptide repeat protein [Treponema sp.]|jgi:tetratricopeptide (TPR) repeat protein|nr:tetratricopeptide repeat protein [Treponema sp.]
MKNKNLYGNVLIVFIALTAAVVAAASPAGGRYALVIGNADYQNIEKLINTVNDARDIAEALRKLGFEVDLKINADEKQFIAAVDRHIRKLAAHPGSEGFFWYAGHAVQIGGVNYLLPVDASVESELILKREAYTLDDLQAELDGAGNKVNVVVLDACRNNPLPSSSRSAGGPRGLAPVQDAPGDLFVMFSTAAGDVADDGKGKRNSPFAEAFLKHINSGDPLALMATDVINETLRLTNRVQRPFISGSIISDKYYSLNPAASHAASVSAPASAREQDVVFYERGAAHLSRGSYDDAITAFTVAIELNPKHSAAYYNRGVSYYAKGGYDQAIADFTDALRLNPRDADAYYKRGNAYAKKKGYERAIVDFTEAIRLNPVYAGWYYNRGLAYINIEDYTHAIADYTEAIRLDPKDAWAYNNRGWAYYKMRDYERAIADYTAALRLDPNNANAKSNLESAKRRGR